MDDVSNTASQEEQPTSAMLTTVTSIYTLLIGSFDFHKPSRAQWRGCFAGKDRIPAQRLLLNLANEARQGTQADQLALYKAAHAILPLHGTDLIALTRLLLAQRPVPLEWGEVLVSALAEAPTSSNSQSAIALDAMKEMAAGVYIRHSEQMRLRSLLNQIQATGLRPGWLKAWMQENNIP